jgi:hypothetical protein
VKGWTNLWRNRSHWPMYRPPRLDRKFVLFSLELSSDRQLTLSQIDSWRGLGKGSALRAARLRGRQAYYNMGRQHSARLPKRPALHLRACPPIPRIKRFLDAGGCIIKMCLIHSPIGAFLKFVNDSQDWHGTREHKGLICHAAHECRFLNTLLSVPYDNCYSFPCIAIP